MEKSGPRPGVADASVPVVSGQRAAVLKAVGSGAEVSRVAELADRLDLHENTVREHLDGLVSAGLVDRTVLPPRGRGRPAFGYRSRPAVGHEMAPPAREYAALALALARQLAVEAPDPVAAAIAAGEHWGHDAADRPGAGADRHGGAVAARHRVVDLLREMGFEPTADARAASVRLAACPILAAANRETDVVCSVHLGLVRGALASFGADASRARLIPFAEPGACRLRLMAEPS